jgi:hypothetical protein
MHCPESGVLHLWFECSNANDDFFFPYPRQTPGMPPILTNAT